MFRMRVALAFTLGFAVATQPAVAATLSITGGFTSFSSRVIVDPPGFSRVNGVDPCTSGSCTQIEPLLADASVSFGVPVDSVTFQNGFFASDPNGDFVNPLNQFLFRPASPQDVSGPGIEFLLGEIEFENGTWSGDARLGFTVSTFSGSEPGFNQTFTDTLVMRLPVFPGGAPDPVQFPYENADYFYFEGNTFTGSVRAFELFGSPTGTNRVSVQLFGKIGSLDLTRFANPVGGFLDPGVGLLPTVPVPAPFGLLTLGLATIASLARGRRGVQP